MHHVWNAEALSFHRSILFPSSGCITQEYVTQYVGLAMGVRVGVWVLTNEKEASLTVEVRGSTEHGSVQQKGAMCL